MARQLFVYKRITAEQKKVQEYFQNLPINGKRTTPQTIKQVREIVSDMSYRIAQTCNVLVSYPRMSIQGQKVVLGEPTIMLPDCSLVGYEKLKEIELNHRK